MGFLSNIGGMLPAAYAGFQKGVDDVTARQQREADAAYQQEQRDRERQMAPLEDEIRKKRLAAAGIKIDNEMELAPGQQERARQELAHLGKIDPLRRSTEEWNAIRESSDNKQRFIESAVPKLGEAIHTNNIAGVNVGVRNLFDAGLFKDVDGLQSVTAARSEIVTAPDGATDFRGQPVKGRAIKVTLSDGRDGFIGTDYMLAQYAKQMQAADAAGAKVIKPGEEWRTPSGRLLAEGKEKVYPGGVVEDANGDFVRIPGVGGASTGSRSGAGGKGPKDAGTQAQDALEFLTKSEEFKILTTSQVASAQLFTERAVAAGVTPREAALIGVEVAKDPAKAKTYIDASGDVKSAYSDPNINGGRPIVLAAGVSSLGEVAKTPEGLKSVAAAVTGILDSQVRATEARTPEQQQAVRNQFIKAAHNPADRAALLKAISGAGPEAVAAMDKKLELLRLYGPKPTTEKPSAGGSGDAQKKSAFGFGGLGGSEKYAPPADSPAGRAQARQTELRAQREAMAQNDAAAKEELSKQFNADLKTLAPVDLARKYDPVRWSMKAEDAAALQQAEKNIR